MANLSFYYGTMASGKTTKLLQDNYNYRKNGHKVVIIKPLIDTKGGNKVVSRMDTDAKVDIIIGKNDEILTKDNLKIIKDAKVLLVDEAQFFSFDQIKELWLVAHVLNISVVCYGLKSDFLGRPFEGTQALLGYADYKNELTVNCECGEVAVFNARKVNDKFVSSGDTVVIDDKSNVSYVPLCSDCYLKKVVIQDNPSILKLEKGFKNN